MKKKWIIGSIIVILLILLFPIKLQLKDGGSIVYRSIVGIYEVKKIKTLGSIGTTEALVKGLSIKLFGMEVYRKTTDVEFLQNAQEEWVSVVDKDKPYSSLLHTDGIATIKRMVEKTVEDYPVDKAADDILALVKEENYVVLEDLRLTSGGEVWQEFYEKVQNGQSAQVRVINYYTLGEESSYSPEYYAEIKDDYPKLFFTCLVYLEGEGFFVGSRAKEETEAERIDQYKYLKHFEGDARTPHAAYSRYDRYVLVNDNAITWEEIEHWMLSSTLYTGDRDLRHKSVYCNYID